MSFLQALSSMLAGKDEAVPQSMLPQVAACLLECLAGHCNSKSALPLDKPSSRYFYSILRTMQAVISQVRRQHRSRKLAASCHVLAIASRHWEPHRVTAS